MTEHFGAIEIALVFGAVLAWAIWEVRRNNRALRRTDEHDRSGS